MKRPTPQHRDGLSLLLTHDHLTPRARAYAHMARREVCMTLFAMLVACTLSYPQTAAALYGVTLSVLLTLLRYLVTADTHGLRGHLHHAQLPATSLLILPCTLSAVLLVNQEPQLICAVLLSTLTYLCLTRVTHWLGVLYVIAGEEPPRSRQQRPRMHRLHLERLTW